MTAEVSGDFQAASGMSVWLCAELSISSRFQPEVLSGIPLVGELTAFSSKGLTVPTRMLHPEDHMARKSKQEQSDFMCLQDRRARESEIEREKMKNFRNLDCDREADTATMGNKYLGNSRLGRE